MIDVTARLETALQIWIDLAGVGTTYHHTLVVDALRGRTLEAHVTARHSCGITYGSQVSNDITRPIRLRLVFRGEDRRHDHGRRSQCSKHIFSSVTLRNAH